MLNTVQKSLQSSHSSADSLYRNLFSDEKNYRSDAQAVLRVRLVDAKPCSNHKCIGPSFLRQLCREKGPDCTHTSRLPNNKSIRVGFVFSSKELPI
jgi:hypothetical protein